MSEGRPKILFLTNTVHFAAGEAISRSYHLLRALTSTYDIALIAMVPQGDSSRLPESLRTLCGGQVQTIPHRHSHLTTITGAASALATRRPLTILQNRNPAMQAAVAERLLREKFQVIHVDHLTMAQYVLPRRVGAPLVLDLGTAECNQPERNTPVYSVAWQRISASQEGSRRQRYESDIYRQMTHLLAPTEEKRAALLVSSPGLAGKVTTLSDGVDTDRLRPVVRDPASRTLLFAAPLSAAASVEGILWFLDTIWPLIKKSVPDARFHIVGEKPCEKIRGLPQADKSINLTEVTGTFRPCAAACAAFILPLLSGQANCDSVVQALSLALPVVSTKVGVEGIAVSDNKSVIIANNVADFSSACVKLLRDPHLGVALGAVGRQLIETQYSWITTGRTLLNTYAKILTAK